MLHYVINIVIKNEAETVINIWRKMKTYKLSIKGKVTGVCFRMETLRFSANFPTLCGYVKNIAESHVEVVMQGDENSIYQMTSWLKVGPPLSCVKSVSVDVYDSPEQFPRFTINY